MNDIGVRCWSGQEKVLNGLIFQLGTLIPISGRNTENGGTTMIKWLINCSPRPSRASDLDNLEQETIEDLLKRAPKGNMAPEEVY